MEKALRGWLLDWIDRGGVRSSTETPDDPVTLLQRIVTAVAGILALASSPIIGILAPHLSPLGALILQAGVVVATVIAANFVVTSKVPVDQPAGFGSESYSKYRYTTTERWLARGIVLVPLVIFLVGLIPAPRPVPDCSVTVTVDKGTRLSSGLSVQVFSGNTVTERIGLLDGRPTVVEVPGTMLGAYSIRVFWSDNSTTDFGPSARCASAHFAEANSGAATITVAPLP